MDIGKREKGQILYWCMFAALIGLVAFLSFYRLDAKYVDPYDEARHGVNAYEMLRCGRIAESTYGYETDYYNLKPPLSMWCIMLSFAVLGRHVLALRAYSAICYLVLTACAGLFVRRHYGMAESVLSMCFLAVNTAPFEAHMIRAGDADSLYVLLFTLAMLCMLEIPQKQSRIYLCGLFFALAFLTKSFHAGMIVIIGGLYLLFSGELKKLSLKTLLRFAGITVAPILVWGLMRIRVDGFRFFRQMLLVDVLGRTNGTLSNNQQPFGWYAQYFLGTMSGRLTVYLWALVICLMGAVYYSRLFTRENYRRIIGFLLWILIPFLAFSAVTNKLIWYLYPVTVPLLLSAGILSGRLIREKELAGTVKIAFACGLLALFFVYGKAEIQTIQKQGGNEFQDLIRQAAETYDGVAENVYLALADDVQEADPALANTVWAQQDVFLAEIYGDWRCREGGVEAFLTDADGILFVSREVAQAANLPENASLTKLSESEHYLVFEKDR